MSAFFFWPGSIQYDATNARTDKTEINQKKEERGQLLGGELASIVPLLKSY